MHAHASLERKTTPEIRLTSCQLIKSTGSPDYDGLEGGGTWADGKSAKNVTMAQKMIVGTIEVVAETHWAALRIIALVIDCCCQEAAMMDISMPVLRSRLYLLIFPRLWEVAFSPTASLVDQPATTNWHCNDENRFLAGSSWADGDQNDNLAWMNWRGDDQWKQFSHWQPLSGW